MSTLVTIEEVKASLQYEPNTGVFTWLTTVRNRMAGKVAGTVNGNGYYQINLKGRFYQSHRLAWLIIYGEWPPCEIDHINCDRRDNRISNLRAASPSQNQYNQRTPKNNTSGIKGVTWSKKSRKWQAQIAFGRRQYRYLGVFDTKDEAAAAYAAAAELYHGEFRRIA